MKVDIFNSGARPESRLIVQTGQEIAPLIDDLITGVSTMVPLTLLAVDVELDHVVPGGRAEAIERFIEKWRGAVAPTSEFDEGNIVVAGPETGEGYRDD